jgi:hypothetical protein
MLLLRLAMVLATGVPSVCTPLSICQVTDSSGKSTNPPRKPRLDVPMSSRNRPGWSIPGSVAPVVWPSSSHGTIVP